MKQLYPLLIALTCCLGLSLPLTAQIINGGFEIRNAEPRGLNNIAPGQFDDLPSWTRIAGSAHYQTNQTSISWVNTLRNVAFDNWPAYVPFNPYEGTGSVELVGDGPQTFGVIGQQLTNLTPNNVYRVEFYVKRLPTNQYRARIAFTVHDSQPTRSLGGNLTPAPSATILSDYVTTNNWTLVSGEFVARAATQWIAIGYEGIQGVFDSNLSYIKRVNENGVEVSTDYYTINIDGVSAVDQGACPQMYAIDIDDRNFCDHNTLYYTPVFDPGPMDPAYASTGGFSATVTGDVTYWDIRYTPFSPSLLSVAVVPNRSMVQTNIAVTMTYHYANGCTASYTNTQGWDASMCWYASYSVTPNPSSSELVIEAKPTSKAASTSATPAQDPIPVHAQLYNGNGNKVKEGSDSSGKLILNVRDLPDGLYFLRGEIGPRRISKQIKIQH